MKTFLAASVSLLAFSASIPAQETTAPVPAEAPAVEAQGQVLVDTEFVQPSPGAPLEAVQEQMFPLKAPSSVTAHEPSTITLGEAPLGNLQPPYVLFQPKGRTDNPEVVSDAILQWNLRSEVFLSGVYELTFQITPQDASVYGGRMWVQFFDETGAPLKFDPGIHPSQLPVIVNFDGDKARVGNATVPFLAGDTLDFKIRFDIARRVWSVWVGTNEVLTDYPFPPQMADTAIPLRMGALWCGSTAGLGDKPDTSYALSKVKLVKLSE